MRCSTVTRAMPTKWIGWFIAVTVWIGGVADANPLRGQAADWRDALPAIELSEQTPFVPEDLSFIDRTGERIQLSATGGDFRLLNLWATWCAPCREEMPSLDRLADQFEDRNFAVLTVASGPHSVGSITAFYEQTGIDNLPVYRDPESALASRLGAVALPSTFVIGPEGRVMARLIGAAQWDAPAVIRLIRDTLSVDG